MNWGPSLRIGIGRVRRWTPGPPSTVIWFGRAMFLRILSLIADIEIRAGLHSEQHGAGLPGAHARDGRRHGFLCCRAQPASMRERFMLGRSGDDIPKSFASPFLRLSEISQAVWQMPTIPPAVGRMLPSTEVEEAMWSTPGAAS